MSKTKQQLKHLYLRGDIWWFRFTYKGIKYRRSLETAKDAEAIKKRDELIDLIKSGQFSLELKENQEIKSNEFINHSKQINYFGELAIEYLEAKDGVLSASDLKKFETFLEDGRLQYFEFYSLNEITSANLREYVKKRLKEKTKQRNPQPVKPALVRKELVYMQRIFSYGRQQGYTTNDPFITYNFRKELLDYDPNEEYLRPEDIQKLLDKVEEICKYLKRLVIFLLETGMRIDETLKLKYRNIDDRYEYIIPDKNTTKNKKEKVIPLSYLAVEQIRLQEEEFKTDKDDFIFKTEKIKSYDSIKKKMKKSFTEAEVEREGLFHMFRHTFACLNLQGYNIYGEEIEPLPIEMISQILGHSSINFTLERYAKYCKQKLVNTFRNRKIKTT